MSSTPISAPPVSSFTGRFREYISGPAGTRIMLFLVTVLVVAAAMTSLVVSLRGPVVYRQGEIARRTVRAPYDIVVEDALETEKRRAAAAAMVKTVFAISDGRESEPSQHLNYLFSVVRELSTAQPAGAAAGGQLQLSDERKSEIATRFHLDLTPGEWDALLHPQLWPSLESSVISISGPIVSSGIITNKSQLKQAIKTAGAVLHDRRTGQDQPVITETTIQDVREAAEKADVTFPAEGFGQGVVIDNVVRKLVRITLQPNIVLDTEETDKRLQRARKEVDASVFRIQHGQALVRVGDLVTPSQETILRQFSLRGSTVGRISQIFAGYLCLAATVLMSLYWFSFAYWPGFRPKIRDLSLLATTLCGSILMIKLYGILAEALSYSFPNLGSDSFLLATPVAAGGILLQVTLGPASALFFTLAFASLTGVFLEDSWLMFLLVLCGNVIGAASVQRCSRRSMFIYGGLRVSGVQMLLVACFLLVSPQIDVTENLSRVLLAAFGGLTAAVMAAGLTPVAEYLGGYVSDIKLLELASLDHPLLRDLSLQAPGTWNHSMVMGQMAEAASEAIGANPLLARVGAFYHDIGKSKKPAYFVENQTGENRHDKLTPSMSALIIKAHVKDGMEMAEEHRLPKAVADFIPQHHGQSLIEYFYVKALKDAAEGEEVDESHYRYPGPRPQTKEAGILMLADSIEASSRTLSDPSPAKIQGLVQKMINKVFASGELNECNLTLKDLHKIAKSFTRVLTGIYHRRVEYNEPAEKTRELRIVKNERQEFDVTDSIGTNVRAGTFAGAKSVEAEKPRNEQAGKDQAGKDQAGKDTVALEPIEELSRGAHAPDSGRRAGESGAKRASNGPSTETLRRLGMQ